MGNAVLNGPRTGQLRKRLRKLDGYENVISNWTVKKTRTGRLLLVGSETHLKKKNEENE